MSDIININPGMDTPAHRPCHVAYTINNTQPVACTIIGDQPLFYMDYEIDYEDEEMALFDSADLNILEQELNTLKKEIDSLDKFSEDFIQSPEERFGEFLSDQDVITKPFERNIENDASTLISVLSQSRIAASYIEFAKDHNVEVTFSDQIIDGEYNRKSGLIYINSNLEFAEQILICARELRRHWQHRQGALINPLMFHPDNAVMINRIQVADLTVSMVRIAWELQLSGVKQAWERVENSSLSDLGRSLAREAFLDFRTLNNGEASTAVFETWFLSERCQAEDKKLIQKMLADSKGYVFDLKQAEESITPALIAALGTMPYGKNYLSQHATTIMGDPIFTDVRDRSNANFLWFIKFERTFRETEHELQGSPVPTADDIRSSHIQNENQGHNYDEQRGVQETTGNVISIFTGAQHDAENEQKTDSKQNGDKSSKNSKLLSPKAESERTDSEGTADIIYLRRWSAE